jgi:hypothetical protein
MSFRFDLSPDEEDRLAGELAEALERMVDTSGCLDMVPLWLRATQRIRGEFLRRRDEPTPALSPGLRQLGKSSRSKYGALAAWRHAVLWLSVHRDIDQAAAAGMVDVYFTPYDRNAPPYSWSGASSRAPGIRQYRGPAELDELARQGCWATIVALRERAARAGLHRSVEAEARQAFIKVAVRTTLRDVLRIEELWKDADGEAW